VFKTLLIANRGEIACRVAATARKLGIKTIAVYSDADADAKHVASCDEGVRIGGAPASESYLKRDTILQVALEHGAEAVHPGYGFLSENEDFAAACASAGLCFVGPPASAIAAMGSKSAAKTLMALAGVPLVPGYHGDNQDPLFLGQQADAIGYPVLIKASAGGGGKGMRIVDASEDFAAALASCQRESLSSFGDDRVLIERYLQKPRHIEIQVFADTHGHCIYLFERDCSVQRRHQKVIEEAPAPGMAEAMRKQMGEAAVAAARAVNYVGAGTVEFIVEPDGRFYFMEMNTRLQVEHPVTEMITGLDLVEWQLRVAAGEPLPLTQAQLHISGHAIEARIYAENTQKGFLPSVGRLAHFRLPEHVAFENADVRVDSGVRRGDVISPYYDPMIAKLIVWGIDRDQARARMLQALLQTEVVGVHTNIEFLSRLMQDESFATADLDTGLIQRRRETLLPDVAPQPLYILAFAAAAVMSQESSQSSSATAFADPWAVQDGWRVSSRWRQDFSFLEGENLREIVIARHGTEQTLEAEGLSAPVRWESERLSSGELMLSVVLADKRKHGRVYIEGERIDVFVEGVHAVLCLKNPLRDTVQDTAHEKGGLTAPMPGKIIAVNVAVGQVVKQGESLLVMEAMKMEHTVNAPVDGCVKEVFFVVGDQVQEGAALILLA